ncbi:MAG TPA: hypothetical protein VEH79_05015 [Gaiellaceae bacterium]|nr:hypothetical protein [Gaiellaceae bacterium]
MRGKGGARDLFNHELRRDGKIVAQLRGVEGENGTVTVEAEVQAGALGRDSQVVPFSFPSRDHAARFVDEALDALQYLGCVVTD